MLIVLYSRCVWMVYCVLQMVWTNFVVFMAYNNSMMYGCTMWVPINLDREYLIQLRMRFCYSNPDDIKNEENNKDMVVIDVDDG